MWKMQPQFVAAFESPSNSLASDSDTTTKLDHDKYIVIHLLVCLIYTTKEKYH